ncbi:MAG TPA: lytic transglycosylase domain-containing protein, partial [Candidatus Micrarchaeota archaeon]
NEEFRKSIELFKKSQDPGQLSALLQSITARLDNIDCRLEFIALKYFPEQAVVSCFGMNNRNITSTGNMPNTDMGQRFNRIQNQMLVGGLQNEAELEYLAAAASRADFYSRADKIYEYQSQRSQGFPRIRRTDENGKTVVDSNSITFPDYIAYENYVRNKYSPTEARVFTFGFTEADTVIGRTLVERLNQYKSIVDRMSSKFGVDKNLIYAVIAQESGGNPNAESWCGAKGLMQLMDATASAMNVRDSKDPGQNIEGGTKYLKQLLSQFGGDAKLALIGYNAGPKRVERYMQNGWLPDETRDYVPRVMSFYQQFQDGKLAVQVDRKSLVSKSGT